MTEPNPRLNRDDIKRLIVGIYDDARRWHWPASTLHEAMQADVWDELVSRTDSGRNRYTLETKGFAQGIVKMVDDALWRDLVYVHLLDGVLSPDGTVLAGTVYSDDRRAHGVHRGSIDFEGNSVTGKAIRVHTFDELLAELESRNKGKPYAAHLRLQDVTAGTCWPGSIKPFTPWQLPWSEERDPEWVARQPKAVQDRVNAAIKQRQLALSQSKGDE